MEYIQVLNNLKHSINNKHTNGTFKKSIKDLKEIFGFNVSTKFLRELSNLNDFRKTTKRINYLMKVNKLKTKRELRFYSCWELNKYKTDVVEYARNLKKKVYSNNCELTTQEEQQLKELKEMVGKCGVEMIPRAEQNLNARQKRRNAFNIGGSVFVKEIKTQDVGNLYIAKKKEVCFSVIA